MSILIADSGATKCEWCLITDSNRKHVVFSQGISPYFLDAVQVEAIIRNELLPFLKNRPVDAVYYYGTGCSNPANAAMIKKAISTVFTKARVEVSHDLMGAARSLCGDEKGIACILG